jgi:dienelactone hydrolase
MGCIMFHIDNQSDVAVVLIHEIYGINSHMHDVGQSLAQYGFDVWCPNLLEREAFDDSQEQEAYHYFMKNIGFNQASSNIRRLLEDVRHQYEKIVLVGFSVGATIAWLCSEEELVDGIVGYYGSRIRDYVSLSPQCPALLFFPQSEASFDVSELIKTLRSKENVEVHQLEGQHGFSNPYSPAYHQQSAMAAFHKMICFIQKY